MTKQAQDRAYIVDADGNPLDLLVMGTEFEAHYKEIRSEGHYEPDSRWTQRHGGHDHLWITVGDREVVEHAHPERRPCDGACGDPTHEETVWVCNIYQGLLRPGMRHSGPFMRTMHTHDTVTLHLAGPALPKRLKGCTLRYGDQVARLPDVLHCGDMLMANTEEPSAAYTGEMMP